MKANEELLAAKRMLAEIREDHLQVMREKELDGIRGALEEIKKMQGISHSEMGVLEALVESAERVISVKSNEFEDYCNNFHSNSQRLLYWSQDWYVARVYQSLVVDPDVYDHLDTFFDLKKRGDAYLANTDVNNLRIVNSLLMDLIPQCMVNNILPALGNK